MCMKAKDISELLSCAACSYEDEHIIERLSGPLLDVSRLLRLNSTSTLTFNIFVACFYVVICVKLLEEKSRRKAGSSCVTHSALLSTNIPPLRVRQVSIF